MAKSKGKFNTYSNYSTFALCPRKWQLGRKYEPKITHAALAEGDLFHLSVAKMYAQNDPKAGEAVFDFTKGEYLKRLTAAKAPQDTVDKWEMKFAALEAMIHAYATQIFVHDSKRFTVLHTEKKFKVKIAPGLTLVGSVDGIWQDRQSGVRFIVEHKYKTGHEEELIALDLQVSLYTLALLEEFGPLPTLYNVALKPGNRQGVKETPADFIARLKTVITDEMANFRWTPGDFREKRFLRQTYSRGRAELTAALNQIRSQDKVMRGIQKDPGKVWRNVGDHCLYFCPFKSICIEEDPLVVDRFFDKKDVPAPAVAPKPTV
jgi:CRISPR/Cas system-associated exonuclease Cas4 (RecB family)